MTPRPKPSADAGQRRDDMARELAALRQFDEGREHPARRRHQPAVGIAEPDDQFPEHGDAKRQQQP